MKPAASASILIARYSEDLGWVARIPDFFRVVIYNKGAAVTCPIARKRADLIVDLKNVGRESGSYLDYIISDEFPETEWTAFVQGDPFPHSPDLVEALGQIDLWQPVQPLTCRYSDRVPPPVIVGRERNEYLAGAAIRMESFSLRTMAPIGFHDEGVLAIARRYREGHYLRDSSNLAAHFLDLCGWPELSAQAAAADFGRGAYGAMFAIHSKRASLPPARVLEKMSWLAKGHEIYGYIFERLWLHFFGLPFLSCPSARELQPVPARSASLCVGA